MKVEKETLEESLPSLFFSHSLISISLSTLYLSGRPTCQHTKEKIKMFVVNNTNIYKT
jgi:hypothetical protein